MPTPELIQLQEALGCPGCPWPVVLDEVRRLKAGDKAFELNGIANPIMRLRFAKDRGALPDLDALEEEMVAGLEFFALCSNGQRITWGEFIRNRNKEK